MIDSRTKMMFQGALNKMPPSSAMNDTLLSEIMDGMRAQAKADYEREIQAIRDGANAQVQAANEKISTLQQKIDSMTMAHGQMQDAHEAMQNAHTQQLNSLQAEISRLTDLVTKDVQEDTPDQEDLIENEKLTALQNSLNALTEQLNNIQRAVSQKPIIPQQKFPPLEFKPIRDSVGNIISVTATPIGGH